MTGIKMNKRKHWLPGCRENLLELWGWFPLKGCFSQMQDDTKQSFKILDLLCIFSSHPKIKGKI
jgi:hypothetical protein